MSEGFKKSHILVVDDMSSNRALLEKMIIRLGQHVITAGSASEALSLCDEYDFDLILLDVSMPGIDGFELAKILKNKTKTKGIKIIFVTGVKKQRLDHLQGLNLGAVDYIEKPIDHELFSSKIKTCLKIVAQEKLLRQHNFELQLEIERRVSLENELRLSAAIFNEGSDAVLITDNQQKIIKVNPAFTQITGYFEQEVLGKTPDILASGKHDKAFYQGMWQSILNKGKWSGEIWNKRKDGIIYPEWETITAVKSGDEIVNYIATFSDISQYKTQEEKIKYLAYQDHLTDLPNKPFFQKQIEQSLSRPKTLGMSGALLYLDINDFKKINETLGHNFGDQLLIHFSQKLNQLVSKNVIVSRFGGDEFVLWVDDINGTHNDAIDSATRLAASIQNEFSKPIKVDQYDIIVTSSIGIAIYPNDGISCEQLIRKADTAMYKAKEEGINTFKFFQLDMEKSAKKRLLIESELRRAIYEGELELHYQPQVNVKSGDVIGAEALLRWESSQLGNVSPADFIPIAETSGLIIEVGNWVLTHACQQIKQWEDTGIFDELQTISINISPVHFESEGFISDLSSTINKVGICASHLDIELTETALVSDINKVRDQLDEIKKIGCSISIDDFGTGYSSLKYLSEFPLDVLKIDKCFVDDIDNKSANLAIVNSIVSMAKMLNAHIVAEGVEQQSQLKILDDAGCDLYQGYLFSPAVTFLDFEALLKPKVPCATLS